MMSQYKDPGTPVNGPQAKRRGYMTAEEEEQTQKELTKRILQERLDSDARSRAERERNVIRNAYEQVNPFVEPVPAFTVEPVIETTVPATTVYQSPEPPPVEHVGETFQFVGTPAIDPQVWAALEEAEKAMNYESGVREELDKEFNGTDKL